MFPCSFLYLSLVFCASVHFFWSRNLCLCLCIATAVLNFCTGFLFVSSRLVWTLDISVVALLLAWIRGRSVTLSGFVLSKRCSNSKAPQSRVCQFLEAWTPLVWRTNLVTRELCFSLHKEEEDCEQQGKADGREHTLHLLSEFCKPTRNLPCVEQA